MKNLLFSIFTIVFMMASGIAQDYGVGSTSKTFRDSSRRNRRVNVRIYYPTDSGRQIAEGQFPVVVLGHGFVMGANAYTNFYNTLGSRGYIVAFVNTEGSFFANHQAYSEDLAFVTNAMQAEGNNSSSPLYQGVAEETALLGHSMGGGAATVAASLVDVETVVTFAPAPLRFDTYTPASQVSADAIVFSATEDKVTPADENHVPIYNSLGSDCKYFISILEGAHCYYAQSNFACDFGERTSGGNIGITRTEQQDIMFASLNPWLDYKLKGDLSARSQFTNGLSSSDAITFENDCTAGLNTNSAIAAPTATIYNSGSKHLTIDLSDKKSFEKVEFYNQNGVRVSTSLSNEINVSNLKGGAYIVKVFTNNGVITKKVLIQN